MASIQNYGFPYLSPPPKVAPPHSPFTPPPKVAPPHSPLKPPPSPFTPPPKVAPPHSPFTPPPSTFTPPPKVAPPHSPFTPPSSPHSIPPPPHIVPTPPTPAAKPPRHSIPPPSPIVTPPPLPPHPIAPPPPDIVPSPPSPPSNHNTTIIIVFVSLGGLFFLVFLSVALFCFLKKKKKMVQETDIVNVHEHLKVKETIVPGPHGVQTVMLSIDDDVQFQEEIKKNEWVGEGLHAKSTGVGASPSDSSHHLIEQKH